MPNADSIAKLLNNHRKEDTTRVRLHIDLFRAVFLVNLDSAKVIGNRIVQLSEKLEYRYGIARGMNALGMVYWYKNDPDRAIAAFQTAIALAVAEENPDLLSMVSNNLGVYYAQLGVLDSAERYDLMAIEAARSLPDKSRLSKAAGDLGMIYYNRGMFVEAMRYIIESKTYYEKDNKQYELVVANIRLGLIFYNINDFEKSLAANREAMRINDSLRNPNLELTILQNLGLLYYDLKKDYGTAKTFLKKAMKLSVGRQAEDVRLSALINLGNIAYEEKNLKEAHDIYTEAYKSPLIPNRIRERAAILVNLGAVYLKMGDMKNAEQSVNEGLKLAREQKFLRFEMNAYQTLAELEAKRSNFSKAYDYHIMYAALRDSIGNETIKQKVAETVFKNALEQMEKEKTLLQMDNDLKQQTIYNQKLLIVAASVILLLVVLLLFVIARANRKQRVLNRELDNKNRELQALNVTKDKFLSIIAHDLKSPFNALLGLLTDLDENYDDYDEESRHKIIRRLKASSYNTFNLLINLLDWSQSQRGQIKADPGNTLIHSLVDEVIAVLSTRAVAKRQAIFNETGEAICAYTDPQILKSILINLVNNAIKFTPNGGVIRVSGSVEQNFVRLEVTDNGIGIPFEEVQHLFRIDTQFRRQGTDNEPGTGLGLVMCREYTTLIGGEIGVDSQLGKGTTFWFTVPLNPQQA